MHPQPTDLIPHRPPMVMIDALVECSGTTARAVKIFPESAYGARDGRIAEALLIECLAQTVAAMQGLQARVQCLPPLQGMLVGVSDFVFHRTARLDVPLELAVEITRQLGPMLAATGRITQAGSPVAEGTLKFYIGENTYAAEKPDAGGQLP